MQLNRYQPERENKSRTFVRLRFYRDLIVSTGFFFENINTGRKVDTNEVNIAIPKIITTGMNPKLKS